MPSLGLGKLLAGFGFQRERRSRVIESKLYARLGHIEVAGVALNADVVDTAPNRGQPARTATHKRVKDCVSGFSQQQRKVGQKFNRFDTGMVVRMLRLLVERPTAFIAFNQPPLR